MKYCVLHNLRFETPAKQDAFNKDIKLKIGGKKVWGETIISGGKDEEGYSTHGLAVRFDDQADMDEVFAFIKDKMSKIPVLKGSVSKHPCSHDESPPSPCMIEEEYTK